MTKFAAIMALAASASALKLEGINDPTNIDIGLNDGASKENYRAAFDEFAIDYNKQNIERGDKNPSSDEFTQPLCAIGGQQDHQDYGGPSDFCCRIYESVQFKGRYYDLCAGQVNPVIGVPTPYDLMAEGWDNEVTSYKCGAKVGIMMCDHWYSAPELCPPHQAESGMPGTQNREIGLTNKVSMVNIVHQHPYSATIYSRLDCNGRGVWLFTDNSLAGSWTKYDDDSNLLLQDGRVMSAQMANGMELDFFSEGDFVSDSYALRLHQNRCVNTDFLSEAFGGQHHLTGDGNTNIHAAWLHKNWFPNGGSIPVGFNDTV